MKDQKSSLEELVQKIKEIPISQIMGHYLTLHRRGNNTLAVCPFHDDHQPSLHISDDKNMFMCFVDNIGGDAISFVRRYKNLDFKEALKDICHVLGWPFDEYSGASKKSPKWEIGLKILSKASQIYFRLGEVDNSGIFKEFIAKRKLAPETIQTYQLGMAPSSNTLAKYLSSIKDPKEASYVLEIAEELGLIQPDKHYEKGHYDYFRSRIIFPIWDQFGQVIGFTSRATSEKQQAKYMNSKDSFLFNKKQLLYGLHLAKNSIREKDHVILVEGNMDQIALSQFGFEQSVAIMGTAMGKQSLERLLVLTKRIYLSLDNDKAGKEAALRVNQLCFEHQIIPYQIDLNPHKDPDEFLAAEGRMAFQARIDQAIPLIDIQLEALVPRPLPELSDRRIEILTAAFKLLAPLKDHLSALERIGRMGKTLGLNLSADQLTEKYTEFYLSLAAKKPNFYEAKQKMDSPASENDNSGAQEQNAEHASQQALTNHSVQLALSEKLLIQELLSHLSLLTHDRIDELLDFVHQTEVKWFISRLRDLAYEVDESQWMQVIENILDQEAQGRISLELKGAVSAILFKLKSKSYPKAISDKKRLEKLFNGLHFKLREHSLREKRIEIKLRQKKCTTKEESQLLLHELGSIDKQLSQLRYQKKSQPLGTIEAEGV